MKQTQPSPALGPELSVPSCGGWHRGRGAQRVQDCSPRGEAPPASGQLQLTLKLCSASLGQSLQCSSAKGPALSHLCHSHRCWHVTGGWRQQLGRSRGIMDWCHCTQRQHVAPGGGEALPTPLLGPVEAQDSRGGI